MGETITCYIPDDLLEQLKEEVEERKAKKEIVGDRVIGTSHVMCEALRDRYDKKKNNK